MCLPLSTRERHLSVLLTPNFRYHRSLAFMRRGKPGRCKRISGHSLCLLRKMRTPASITLKDQQIIFDSDAPRVSRTTAF